MLPEKLGGFFPQFNVDRKSRGSVTDREVDLQRDQVRRERGKGKACLEKNPGDGESLERKEGEMPKSEIFQ